MYNKIWKKNAGFFMALLLAILVFSSCQKENSNTTVQGITYKNTTYEIAEGFEYGAGLAGTSPISFGRHLFLMSEGLTYNNVERRFEGSGKLFYVPIFSEQQGIIAGKYVFDRDDNNSYDAFTFHEGEFYYDFNFEGSSAPRLGENYCRISGGSIEISISGNIFELTIDCKDSNEQPIDGYYKGTIPSYR